MTAQISEAQALSELSEMFPRFEKSVLLTILEVNGMNLSKTIEQLLKVEEEQAPPGDIYVVKKGSQSAENAPSESFDPNVVYDQELAARLQEEEAKGLGGNEQEQIDRAVRRSLRSVGQDSNERVNRFLRRGEMFFKKPVEYFNEGGKEVHEEVISAKLAQSMWMYRSPRFIRK